jgi:hypothetical protein
MINRNALESSNENSLVVNNVIDTRSEHSVAQVKTVSIELSSRDRQITREDSLPSAQRQTFISNLLICRRIIAVLVQSRED